MGVMLEGRERKREIERRGGSEGVRDREGARERRGWWEQWTGETGGGDGGRKDESGWGASHDTQRSIQGRTQLSLPLRAALSVISPLPYGLEQRRGCEWSQTM